MPLAIGVRNLVNRRCRIRYTRAAISSVCQVMLPGTTVPSNVGSKNGGNWDCRLHCFYDYVPFRGNLELVAQMAGLHGITHMNLPPPPSPNTNACANTMHVRTQCMCEHNACANTMHVRTQCMCEHNACANTMHVRTQCMCEHNACANTMYVRTHANIHRLRTTGLPTGA